MKSRNSLYLILARLLSLIVTLVSAPLFLDWLGKERYGLYAIGLNYYLFVSLIDIGFNVGAQKRMTEAFHVGDAERAWRIHRVQLLCGFSVVFAAYLLYLLLGFTQHIRGISFEETKPFFAFLGLQFCASWASLYFSSVLAAQNKFSLQGAMFFLTTFCAAAGALAMAYHYRTVVSVAAGYGCGSLVGLGIFLVILKIQDPAFQLRLSYDKDIARDIGKVGATSYPNRLLGTFANRSDRQLIGTFVDIGLAGWYATACRPAEVVTELLGSMIDTTQTEITKRVHESAEKGSAALHRNSLIVWAVACSFLVVPCSMGESIIRQWMHRDLFALQGLVMLGIAINYAGELHYRALGTYFVAKGTLYRSVWFPAANAVLTLAFTIPVVREWGLPGVGVMNALLTVVQLYPRMAIMRKETGGHFPVGRHFLKSMGIFGLSGGFCAVGYWLSWTMDKSLLSLLAAPVLAFGCLWACIGLGLTPAPTFLGRFGFKTA